MEDKGWRWRLGKFRGRQPRNSFRYENVILSWPMHREKVTLANDATSNGQNVAVAVDVAAAVAITVAVAVAAAAVATFTKGIPSAAFSGFRNILAALSSN
ncbi:hypothetical protein HZH68_011094 [Vespula germanica]|uniref:Uncharacterized protein n=2 Tax=Vespula TaxID=7451 RepID=A0A834JN43_VESGE|nr:hypothetical protein HZH68_011094 [Vespula germanica]